MSKGRVESIEMPDWVRQGHRAAIIFQIIYLALNEKCKCKVCRIVRENMEIWKPIEERIPRIGEK